jgi:hypothetical protein
MSQSQMNPWSFPDLSEQNRRVVEHFTVCLIARRRGEKPVLLGTGSIVHSDDGLAICLTAGHVLEDGVAVLYPNPQERLAQSKLPTGGPSAPGDLIACVFTLGQEEPITARVRHATVSRSTDLGLCELVSPVFTAQRAVLALNSDLFPVGTRVLAIGANLYDIPADQRDPSSDYFGIRPGFQPRSGTVTAVDLQDLHHKQAYSYTLSFPIPDGMSGGPILLLPQPHIPETRRMQMIAFASYDDAPLHWRNVNNTEVLGEGKAIGVQTAYLTTHDSPVDWTWFRLFDRVREGKIADVGRHWQDKEIFTENGVVSWRLRRDA